MRSLEEKTVDDLTSKELKCIYGALYSGLLVVKEIARKYRISEPDVKIAYSRGEKLYGHRGTIAPVQEEAKTSPKAKRTANSPGRAKKGRGEPVVAEEREVRI